MAESLQVGSLFATLGLDSTEFVDSLKKSGTELAAMGPKADDATKKLTGKMTDAGKKLTTHVTAPIMAAGTALFAMAAKAGSSAEEIMNLSAASGMSTKQLQEMQYVADQVGFDLTNVTGASAMLQRKLMGVEQDTGRAADTLKQLGVSVKGPNGELRSMGDLMPEIIGKLQGMENETKRNMLAAQVFGGNFKELAPILGMSAGEMKKLTDEAHSLGLVIGEDGLSSAAAFDDQIGKLQATMAGLGKEVAGAAMPIFQDGLIPLIEENVIPMVKTLISWVAAGIKWFAEWPDPLKKTAIVFLAVAAAVGPLLMALAPMITSVSGLITLWPTLGAAVTAAIPGIIAILPVIGTVVAGLLALYEVQQTLRAAMEWWEEQEAAKKAKEQAKKGGQIAGDYIKSGDHSIRKQEEERMARWNRTGAYNQPAPVAAAAGVEVGPGGLPSMAGLTEAMNSLKDPSKLVEAAGKQVTDALKTSGLANLGQAAGQSIAQAVKGSYQPKNANYDPYNPWGDGPAPEGIEYAPDVNRVLPDIMAAARAIPRTDWRNRPDMLPSIRLGRVETPKPEKAPQSTVHVYGDDTLVKILSVQEQQLNLLKAQVGQGKLAGVTS